MTQRMHRVTPVREPCFVEILFEAAPGGAVTHRGIALTVEDEYLLRISPLEPALQGKGGIIGEVDHPAHIVLLSFHQMDFSLLEIDVPHRKPQCFADPDAGPDEEQDESPVPGVVDNGEEPLHILQVHNPRQCLGKLQPDPSFEK